MPKKLTAVGVNFLGIHSEHTAKMSTCSICIDDFKKYGQKKKFVCPYCPLDACLDCTQKYLLSSVDDPHCMGCRRGWTREILMTLGDSWALKTYKKHREEVLVQREKARLPRAQEHLIHEKDIEERRKYLKDVVEPELQRITNIFNSITYDISRLRNHHDAQYTVAGEPLNPAQPAHLVGGGAAGGKVVEKREFIMKCPVSDCRGFLSSAYKCGVCETYTCSSCHEVKKQKDDPTHTCKAELVETVKTLKKETKPCPKCAAAIFKIDGCDMMFCTSCNTPFSWNTGKMISGGYIHNPHYFDYLRATGQAIGRAPGDAPAGCAAPEWIYPYMLTTGLIGHADCPDYGNIQAFCRFITHLYTTELPKLRRISEANPDENVDVNMRYLKKEIDEKRWKTLLQMREKRRQIALDTYQRLDGLVAAGGDIIRGLYRQLQQNTKLPPKVELVKNTIPQLTLLVQIYNDGIKERNALFKCNGKLIEWQPNQGHYQNQYAFVSTAKTTKTKKTTGGAGGGAAGGTATPTTEEMWLGSDDE
jgi:hypothetical protein